MKFGTAAAVVYGATFAFGTFQTAFAADEQQNRKGALLGYFKDKFGSSNENKDLDEDEAYWNRLMQETVGSLPPPTPPVSVPWLNSASCVRTHFLHDHTSFLLAYSTSYT
jgi:hypothetical protein